MGRLNGHAISVMNQNLVLFESIFLDHTMMTSQSITRNRKSCFENSIHKIYICELGNGKSHTFCHTNRRDSEVMGSVPSHASQPLSHFSRCLPSLSTLPNFMQPNLNISLADLIKVNVWQACHLVAAEKRKKDAGWEKLAASYCGCTSQTDNFMIISTIKY